MLQHATSVALTVTNLHSLVSAASLLAGWTSAAIPVKANNYQDVALSCSFTTHASNRTAGLISVYAYAALYDTGGGAVYPDIFSAGTEGAEGTATVHDLEHFGYELKHVTTIAVDTTASEIYAFSQQGLAAVFGAVIPPSHICLFVTTTASTDGTAAFAAAGSTVHYTGITEA